MKLQKNTCLEIVFLENYHEGGEQEGRKWGGEVASSKIPNGNPPMRNTTPLPRLSRKQTSKHL